MPIYEYHCTACNHHFEKLVSRRDAPVQCDSCGSSEVKKQLSGFAFKSGGKFVSSSGDGCSSCHASTCKGCSSSH